MTASGSSVATAARRKPALAGMIAFVRRELAPFPGRATATLRIAVASVVVLVLCMVLRVPEAYLSVWMVLRVATEESGQSLLAGILAMLALTVGLALALVTLFVAIDQPALRFRLIGFAD